MALIYVTFLTLPLYVSAEALKSYLKKAAGTALDKE